MLPQTLDEVQKIVDKLDDPRNLLGKDVDTVHANLRKLLFITHPDRNPGDLRAVMFTQLLQTLAEEAVKPYVTITTKKRTYKLLGRKAIGDISNVYLGESGKKRYIIKESRGKQGNRLLETEHKNLAILLKEAGDLTYHKYLPLIVETHLETGKEAKRFNISVYKPDYLTLEEVHSRQPQLEGRHLAWIFKRLLTAIGFCHRYGIVHGAVLPSHVMIDPVNHGLQLIGFGQSLKAGSVQKIGSAKYLNYYPAETRTKGAVGSYTDIFQAACNILFLAGVNPIIPLQEGLNDAKIPGKFKALLRACLITNPVGRPNDAWELYDELVKVLEKVYGKPKFCVLEV